MLAYRAHETVLSGYNHILINIITNDKLAIVYKLAKDKLPIVTKLNYRLFAPFR